MSYTRRRTWPERPDRQDYEICCEGLEVGRVYFTLDEAAADFKRSYEAMRAKAGLPKPQAQ